MLTRRSLPIAASTAFGILAAGKGNSQGNLPVRVQIRTDQSVQATIPPILLRDLTRQPDTSAAATELAERAPPGRGAPIIFLIIGVLAILEIYRIIRELMRQTYYGGVLIDVRQTPPLVSNSPAVPANMVFVFTADNTVQQFESKNFSADVLTSVLRK